MSQPINSILNDKPLVEEMKSRVSSGLSLPKSAEANVEASLEKVFLQKKFSPSSLDTRPNTEAIISLFARPALLIKNDTFEIPSSDIWKTRLLTSKTKIEKAIRSVGRVEVSDHPSFDWLGSGWMIDEDVFVTNRHVAQEFAYKSGKNNYKFKVNPSGKTIDSNIDFKEEYKVNTKFEVDVKKILFMEDDKSGKPDLAFLLLNRDTFLPPPIIISTSKQTSGDFIAAIGYPARDPRNDMAAMVKIFGDIYNVKRLLPGSITSIENDSFLLTHDCSTLGGNSGCVLISIESGEAVGLHFGGEFRKTNYAVKGETLLKELKKLKPSSYAVNYPEIDHTRPPQGSPKVLKDKVGKIEDYVNKVGFDENFLAVKVLLPSIENTDNIAYLTESDKEYVLKYTHFSIVMNKNRRLSTYTATNINGNTLRNIPRNRDDWRLDPRIDGDHQTGNFLYYDNDLDRGHMVRRRDPVWEPNAAEANDDTFTYTNACPQHKDLNQHNWNDLENYILDNAGVYQLKVSVFTGPVFDDNDKYYRKIQIPEQFWKVVVMVREDTGQLSATAYMLSQRDLITNLEFVYGEFRTYQVAISTIEKKTGLNFSDLKNYDPKNKLELYINAPLSHFDEIIF